MVAAAHDAPPDFESPGNIGFWWSASPGRDQNNSGENGYGEGEEENAEIGQAGNIKTAESDGRYTPMRALSAQKAKASRRCLRGRTRKRLSTRSCRIICQRVAPMARRMAISFGPGTPADEQKVGEVGASDEEYGSSGGIKTQRGVES